MSEQETVAIMAAIIYASKEPSEDESLSRLQWASSEAKLLYDDVVWQIWELDSRHLGNQPKKRQ